MSESVESIRVQASTIVSRIKSDPAFKAQLEQDPENTLVGAGLPASAVPDFLADLQTETGEVKGYLLVDCSYTCTSTSCTFTL